MYTDTTNVGHAVFCYTGNDFSHCNIPNGLKQTATLNKPQDPVPRQSGGETLKLLLFRIHSVVIIASSSLRLVDAFLIVHEVTKG
jgi:hypothetical protein